jgi:predicted esterase
MDVEYRESDHAHWIEPAHADDAAEWLAETIP